MTNARTRAARLGLATIVAGLLLALLGLTSPAGAASVTPEQSASDNPTCVDLDPTWVYEFKINETPTDGDYPVTQAQSGVVGGGTVTIDNAGVVGGVYEFDWSSTIAWDAVIVKQGDGAQFYDYTPGSFGDTDLTPSLGNGQPTGSISHVTFCRDGVDPEPEPEECPEGTEWNDANGNQEVDPGECEEPVIPEADLSAAVACGVPTGMKVTITNSGDGDGTVDVLSGDVVVHDDVAVAAGQTVEVIVAVAEDTAYDIEVAGVQTFTGTRDCVGVLPNVVTKDPAKPAVQVQGVQVQRAAQTLPATGDEDVTMALVGLGLVMLGAGTLLISKSYRTT